MGWGLRECRWGACANGGCQDMGKAFKAARPALQRSQKDFSHGMFSPANTKLTGNKTTPAMRTMPKPKACLDVFKAVNEPMIRCAFP
jgi:hypothetical protein